MNGEIKLKTSILALIAVLGFAVSFDAQARIMVRTCTNYNIHVQLIMPDGSVQTFDSPRKYCWNEYLPEPGDQPYEDPVFIPGSDNPFVPNDQMCASTLENWPEDCDEDNAPTVVSNGCTGVPDGDGFAASFISSCDNHDVCYTTVGSTKSQCDANLGSDMEIACIATYDMMINDYIMGNIPAYYRGRQLSVPMLMTQRRGCIDMANTYQSGVSAVPSFKFYSPAQKLGICIAAHDARSLYCGQ